MPSPILYSPYMDDQRTFWMMRERMAPDGRIFRSPRAILAGHYDSSRVPDIRFHQWATLNTPIYTNTTNIAGWYSGGVY